MLEFVVHILFGIDHVDVGSYLCLLRCGRTVLLFECPRRVIEGCGAGNWLRISRSLLPGFRSVLVGLVNSLALVIAFDFAKSCKAGVLLVCGSVSLEEL